MVNDLTAMLQLLEASTFFLTGVGGVLTFITYQIGIQRSLLTGMLFAGLVAFLYGLFVSSLTTLDFVFVGVIILAFTALLVFILAHKSVTKVGGVA
jgi:hypothetical protein